MLKRFTVIAASLAFTVGTISPAYAAPCRDAKGKFIKCPTTKPAPVRCRGAKGRFVKCGTPGSHPA